MPTRLRPACLLSMSCLILASAAVYADTPADAGSVAASAAVPVIAEAAASPDALREQARALRAEAEVRYRADEPRCYARFLVNRCLDQARDARLARIAEARALEIEASKLELARKQQAFETRHGQDPEALAPPDALPQPMPLPDMPADRSAEAIRAAREAEAQRAATQAEAARMARDAERAAARARAEAAAAERATRAERDRERYERRIQEREAALQKAAPDAAPDDSPAAPAKPAE